MTRLLALLRPSPSVTADVAAYEADVRARMAAAAESRTRQQVEAERAWLGTDVTTPDFLAEYLPGVAA